jgi:alpha-tubulin suppressor-like RCC1 family protein
VTFIAGGRDHGLAVLANGTVRAWGANTYGQLGDGTTTRRTSPVPVPGLTGVETVTAGRAYSAAL